MKMSDRVFVRSLVTPFVFVLTQTQQAHRESFDDVPSALINTPLDGPWFDRYQLREMTTGTTIEFMLDATVNFPYDDEALLKIVTEYMRRLEQEIVARRAQRIADDVKKYVDKQGKMLMVVDRDTYVVLDKQGLDLSTVMLVENKQ